MSTQELILRLACALLGAAIILTLLISEVRNQLDEMVWIICGILSALFIIAALIGPAALGHFLGVTK